MERVFHGSSRIMRTFWKFVHVATLLLPHRHPNSKRNIWHRYSTRFANKFHRKLQKPKKEGSPLRIIRTFWKIVNVATLLLPHRHPDSERSIVTRHVSPTSFTEDSSSKKKKITFDFEFLADLAADLLAQVLELLRQRRVRNVRLQAVLAAQLQQRRIANVVALIERKTNKQTKEKRLDDGVNIRLTRSCNRERSRWNHFLESTLALEKSTECHHVSFGFPVDDIK